MGQQCTASLCRVTVLRITITHNHSHNHSEKPCSALFLFTTATVDNLDHTPSSTSAHNSFHGTGVSLHQHPDSDNSGSDRHLDIAAAATTANQVIHLPSVYTFVQPCKLMQPQPKLANSHTGLEKAATDAVNC